MSSYRTNVRSVVIHLLITTARFLVPALVPIGAAVPLPQCRLAGAPREELIGFPGFQVEIIARYLQVLRCRLRLCHLGHRVSTQMVDIWGMVRMKYLMGKHLLVRTRKALLNMHEYILVCIMYVVN